MANAFDVVERLTRNDFMPSDSSHLLSSFSYEFGWRPSAIISGLEDRDRPGSAHLVVEHGLENTAVLTFLGYNARSQDLQIDARRRLLSLPYNNLVDWHIWVDYDRVRYMFVRSDPAIQVYESPISRSDYSALSRSNFESATERSPAANLPALDDALMESISRWKRILSADSRGQLSNRHLSALFNAILLTRTVEDLYHANSQYGRQLLSEALSGARSVFELFQECIGSITGQRINEQLLDKDLLNAFDDLPRIDLQAIFSDFYRHPGVPYSYDFAVMSKHALSRIYERYVSLLRFEEDDAQLRLLPQVPREEHSRASGAVYTPQFIAQFFTKYVEEHLPPAAFRKATVADLACGSGIFLRSMLEAKFDGLNGIHDPSSPDEALRSLLGVDLDENACAATMLSLATLFLVNTGEFPDELPIYASDAGKFLEERPDLIGSMDVFVTNPPYVRWEKLPEETRRLVRQVLGEDAVGRSDSYLAFLRLGVECLRPGGLGLFVLPQTFLTADAARGLREWIHLECRVVCIADLSSVPVFGEVGTYVMLLIVQRKAVSVQEVPATIIRCRRYPGDALQDYLDGKWTRTPHYSIEPIEQAEFGRSVWTLPRPGEVAIQRKLDSLPSLRTIASVSQGIVTGLDRVFILPEEGVPPGEFGAYRPFLPDRMIGQFHLPSTSARWVFYPFEEDRKLSESEIAGRYPETWKRLQAERGALERRSSVRRGNSQWWEPSWPRAPGRLLVPKLVSPHLSLLPRFGIDGEGKWAVGRSPTIVPHSSDGGADADLLKVLAAILNSSIAAWYFERNGRKFRGGYKEIEAKMLRDFPIPPPNRLDNRTVASLVEKVDELSDERDSLKFRRVKHELDLIVAELYGLSDDESEVLLQ